MTTATGIRPCEPGKYATIIDQFVDDLGCMGADNELGDVQDFGYYQLVSWTPEELQGNAWAYIDGDRMQPELTVDELAFLVSHSSAIIYENDQGFVDVTYFETLEAAQAAWEQLESEYVSTNFHEE